jgi:hypothetical protein
MEIMTYHDEDFDGIVDLSNEEFTFHSLGGYTAEKTGGCWTVSGKEYWYETRTEAEAIEALYLMYRLGGKKAIAVLDGQEPGR